LKVRADLGDELLDDPAAERAAEGGDVEARLRIVARPDGRTGTQGLVGARGVFDRLEGPGVVARTRGFAQDLLRRLLADHGSAHPVDVLQARSWCAPEWGAMSVKRDEWKAELAELDGRDDLLASEARRAEFLRRELAGPVVGPEQVRAWRAQWMTRDPKCTGSPKTRTERGI